MGRERGSLSLCAKVVYAATTHRGREEERRTRGSRKRRWGRSMIRTSDIQTTGEGHCPRSLWERVDNAAPTHRHEGRARIGGRRHGSIHKEKAREEQLYLRDMPLMGK